MKWYSFWFVLTMLMQWTKAYTIKKNTESLLVAIKETVLEVNADTTKCVVSQD